MLESGSALKWATKTFVIENHPVQSYITGCKSGTSNVPDILQSSLERGLKMFCSSNHGGRIIRQHRIFV